MRFQSPQHRGGVGTEAGRLAKANAFLGFNPLSTGAESRGSVP